MTKLQIISKQWSLIYDLLLLNKGASERTLDEIERDWIHWNFIVESMPTQMMKN